MFQNTQPPGHENELKILTRLHLSSSLAAAAADDDGDDDDDDDDDNDDDDVGDAGLPVEHPELGLEAWR